MATIDLGPEIGSLYYEQHGSGPPLLLLHTFRTQIELGQRIVPSLMSEFTVTLPDLPGHGRSDRFTDVGYDAELFVTAMTRFAERLDLTDLTVVGESIGGSIALALAATSPERIARVVAINPHNGGPLMGGRIGRVVSSVGRRTSATSAGEPLLLRSILEEGFADKSNLPREFVRLLRDTAKAAPNHGRTIRSMLVQQASWEALREKYYPQIDSELDVQLIYGDQDWGPLEYRDSNVELIPAVESATIVPATGHFTFLDNPSVALNAVLGDRSELKANHPSASQKD